MYSHKVDLARTIVGIVGNVISLGLFAAPVPTFKRVIQNKSVEEFKYHPYIACLMNCFFWVLYGLPIIHPNSTLVITINGIGVVIELTYLGIYFFYTDKSRKLQIFFAIIVEIVVVVGVGIGVVKGFHTHEARSKIIGVFGIIFCIVMYMAPLTVMYKVIKTKSVEYMPFSLSLAAFLNGICWTVYSLLEFDINLLIPNGTGAVLSLVQLVLYGIYYKSTPKKEDKMKAQVQLSSV